VGKAIASEIFAFHSSTVKLIKNFFLNGTLFLAIMGESENLKG